MRAKPTKDALMVANIQTNINLINISPFVQTGTIEVLPPYNAIAAQFVRKGPPILHTFGSVTTYLCGNLSGTGSKASRTTSNSEFPFWPGQTSSTSEPATFSIPPFGRAAAVIGALYYKSVAANDDHYMFNQNSSMNLRITIKEDRGAVIGYGVMINRCYEPVTNTICTNDGPTASNYDCDWGKAYGVPREINGGRPF